MSAKVSDTEQLCSDKTGKNRKYKLIMKSKFYIIQLLGVLTCGLMALAQDTNPPAAAPIAPADAAPAATPAVPADTAPAATITESQPAAAAPHPPSADVI